MHAIAVRSVRPVLRLTGSSPLQSHCSGKSAAVQQKSPISSHAMGQDVASPTLSSFRTLRLAILHCLDTLRFSLRPPVEDFRVFGFQELVRFSPPTSAWDPKSSVGLGPRVQGLGFSSRQPKLCALHPQS